MKSQIGRYVARASFVVGIVALWCLVLPWVSARPSALLYTQIIAMKPNLDGLECDLSSSSSLAASQTITLVSTPVADYPPGPLGEAVRLGKKLVNETSLHPLTKPYVGNQLNCTSCHLDAGQHPRAASFIGVAAAYPAYSPRESAVITLEDRILNCFERSQNGVRPPNGSQVSVAIASYITWLSRNMPINMNPIAPLGPNSVPVLEVGDGKPRIEQGQLLYADRCASCHEDDGSGSDEGPPVWGNQSFNDGAGLSTVPKMASWLKVAMPLDDPDLTNEEAWAIAAYVNSHARPEFRSTSLMNQEDK